MEKCAECGVDYNKKEEGKRFECPKCKQTKYVKEIPKDEKAKN